MRRSDFPWDFCDRAKANRNLGSGAMSDGTSRQDVVGG